jgi:hypothetical protein
MEMNGTSLGGVGVARSSQDNIDSTTIETFFDKYICEQQ